MSESLRTESALIPLDAVPDAGIRDDVASVIDRIDAFQAAAAVYDSAWRGKDLDLRVVQGLPDAISPRSEYVIGVRDPDGVAAALAEEGIEAERPLNARRRRLLTEESPSFSGARAFYSRALCIPSHPGLDVGELLFTADVIVRHLRGPHA
jgi:hypothetical protein